MEIKRITRTDDPLYETAIGLYKTSFPPHEQRQEASQAEILSNPAYHFDTVSDNGEFVGEILYWDIGNALYIEHFCVMPALRSRRYGQRILEACRKKPLILEIDPPEDEISIRRKGFYERCGFIANPYPHIHPAYHRGNKGHRLVVMSSPEMLTPEEYARFDDYLKSTVMKNAY